MGGSVNETSGRGLRLGKKEGWLKELLKCNKQLVYMKTILFLFMGGMTAFLPFLTLHMQVLGITVREIAIIYAFLPIASLLGPPVSGVIADKSRHYKFVLSLNILLAISLHLLLLSVPSRTSNTLSLQCGGEGSAMSWDLCHPCHDEQNWTRLELSLEKCKYTCDTPTEDITLCLHHNEDLPHCRTFNLTQQIPVNASLSSWRSSKGGQEDITPTPRDDAPISHHPELQDTCSHSWDEIFHQDKIYTNLTCPGKCEIKCKVENFPPCVYPEDPSASSATFWIYFALRMTGTFFLSSSFTMMDATTLAVIKQHDVEYGRQRILSTLGQGLVPFISGVLVDRYSVALGYSDYAPAFYLGAAFIFLAIFLISQLHVEVDTSSPTVWRDLTSLLTKPEIDVFLVMILVIGSNWGYIESYLFVYLIELKAPNYLLGLTLTVGCLVGIPVLYMADQVVNKLGRPNIFIISFFAYAIRHIGYAYMPGPWYVFPFELLEVLTYQIMWVAACTYCPILAPKGLLATMTGLAGATHYSVGRGVGALVGGNLIAKFGLSTTFRIFAYISLGTGIAYTLIHYFCLKELMEKKEAKAAEEQKLREESGEPMLEVPTIFLNGSRRPSLAEY